MPISWFYAWNPPVEPVVARLGAANEVLSAAAHYQLRIAVDALAIELAAASPKGRGDSDGPRVAESWEVNDFGSAFRVYNRSPHLYYVLKGNNYPHSGAGDGYIYPVRSQFLRFVIDGNVIYARRVRAVRPNNFIAPVLRTWRLTLKGVLGIAGRATAHWTFR